MDGMTSTNTRRTKLASRASDERSNSDMPLASESHQDIVRSANGRHTTDELAAKLLTVQSPSLLAFTLELQHN